MFSLPTCVARFPFVLVILAALTSAQDFEPATTTFPAADPDGEILDELQPDIEAKKSFDVHLHNGEFFVEHTDLVIKGRGFDFIWKRTYRSRVSESGPLGYNWDHSYNIYIEQDGADLILHDGDSRDDRFIPTETPDVWGAPGQFRTIYLNANGTYTVLTRHNSKWLIHPLNGSNRAGKIKSIIDRNGNVMLFEYGPRTGRLIRIKDTLHEDNEGTANDNLRTIEVRYNAQGYISEIEDFCTDLGVGGSGRIVRYVYYSGTLWQAGDAGDLATVYLPAIVGTSTGNDFPTGKRWTYTYTKNSPEPLLKHNILTVKNPKGQLVIENEYYDYLATAYKFDRIQRQTIGGGSGPQFNYWYTTQTPSTANNNATRLTTVNDRVGNVCELYYEDQFLSLMREFSGRAPNSKLQTTDVTNLPVNPLRPALDPESWDTQISTNSDGLIDEILHPNGEMVTRCYDSTNPHPRARGNLLLHTNTPGAGISADDDGIVLRVAEKAFISVFNFASERIDPLGRVTLRRYDGPGIAQVIGGCASTAAASTGTATSILRQGGAVPVKTGFPKNESVEQLTLMAPPRRSFLQRRPNNVAGCARGNRGCRADRSRRWMQHCPGLPTTTVFQPAQWKSGHGHWL